MYPSGLTLLKHIAVTHMTIWRIYCSVCGKSTQIGVMSSPPLSCYHVPFYFGPLSAIEFKQGKTGSLCVKISYAKVVESRNGYVNNDATCKFVYIFATLLKSPLFRAMHRWQSTDAPDVMRGKIHVTKCSLQGKRCMLMIAKRSRRQELLGEMHSSKKTGAGAWANSDESFSSNWRNLCDDFRDI